MQKRMIREWTEEPSLGPFCYLHSPSGHSLECSIGSFKLHVILFWHFYDQTPPPPPRVTFYFFKFLLLRLIFPWKCDMNKWESAFSNLSCFQKIIFASKTIIKTCFNKSKIKNVCVTYWRAHPLKMSRIIWMVPMLRERIGQLEWLCVIISGLNSVHNSSQFDVVWADQLEVDLPNINAKFQQCVYCRQKLDHLGWKSTLN